MLIPSKFNGYVKNVRLYNAGGGVPEAMLISAAIGGGTAAVTGGDPLKGALLGALSGGVGAGFAGPAATAAAPVVEGATTAAGAGIPSLIPAAPTAFVPEMGAQGLNAAGRSGLGLTPGNAQGGTNFALNAPTVLPGSTNYALNAPTFLPSGAPSGGGGIANLSPPRTSFQTAMSDPFAYIKKNQMQSAMAGLAGATGAQKNNTPDEEKYTGPLSRFRFNPETYRPAFAEGGITSLPFDGYDQQVGEDPYLMASGGISSLGGYSDGGRMLKGPGDGMSDSIPGVIANKRPARLADGEFVVSSDVVSGLGNGSTDAGAKQLYAMMNKVRQARTGRKAQGREINPRQYVPA